MPYDLSRLGIRNLGGGDELELFLIKWSGEIFSRFPTVCKFFDKSYTKHITEGKAARFDAVGEAVAKYFTVGQDNLLQGGNAIAHDEFTIALDGPLISWVLVPEVDELMNHYNERARYTDKIAAALARQFDQNVAATGILAARSPARIPDGFGGSVITGVNMAYDTDVLVQAAFTAAERLDDKDVPADGRWLFLRPAAYYRLVQHDKVIHRDFNDGTNGSIAKGTVHEVAGLQIVKTNHLPNSVITTDKAKYNGDFTNTVGLVMTDEAVGTVKRQDLTTEAEWKIEVQSHLMLAKFLLGHGVLRPECAVELVHEEPEPEPEPPSQGGGSGS